MELKKKKKMFQSEARKIILFLLFFFSKHTYALSNDEEKFKFYLKQSPETKTQVLKQCRAGEYLSGGTLEYNDPTRYWRWDGDNGLIKQYKMFIQARLNPTNIPQQNLTVLAKYVCIENVLLPQALEDIRRDKQKIWQPLYDKNNCTHELSASAASAVTSSYGSVKIRCKKYAGNLATIERYLKQVTAIQQGTPYNYLLSTEKKILRESQRQELIAGRTYAANHVLKKTNKESNHLEPESQAALIHLAPVVEKNYLITEEQKKTAEASANIALHMYQQKNYGAMSYQLADLQAMWKVTLDVKALIAKQTLFTFFNLYVYIYHGQLEKFGIDLNNSTTLAVGFKKLYNNKFCFAEDILQKRICHNIDSYIDLFIKEYIAQGVLPRKEELRSLHDLGEIADTIVGNMNNALDFMKEAVLVDPQVDSVTTAESTSTLNSGHEQWGLKNGFEDNFKRWHETYLSFYSLLIQVPEFILMGNYKNCFGHAFDQINSKNFLSQLVRSARHHSCFRDKEKVLNIYDEFRQKVVKNLYDANNLGAGALKDLAWIVGDVPSPTLVKDQSHGGFQNDARDYFNKLYKSLKQDLIYKPKPFAIYFKTILENSSPPKEFSKTYHDKEGTHFASAYAVLMASLIKSIDTEIKQAEKSHRQYRVFTFATCFVLTAVGLVTGQVEVSAFAMTIMNGAFYLRVILTASEVLQSYNAFLEHGRKANQYENAAQLDFLSEDVAHELQTIHHNQSEGYAWDASIGVVYLFARYAGRAFNSMKILIQTKNMAQATKALIPSVAGNIKEILRNGSLTWTTKVAKTMTLSFLNRRGPYFRWFYLKGAKESLSPMGMISLTNAKNVSPLWDMNPSENNFNAEDYPSPNDFYQELISCLNNACELAVTRL